MALSDEDRERALKFMEAHKLLRKLQGELLERFAENIRSDLVAKLAEGALARDLCVFATDGTMEVPGVFDQASGGIASLDSIRTAVWKVFDSGFDQLGVPIMDDYGIHAFILVQQVPQHTYLDVRGIMKHGATGESD